MELSVLIRGRELPGWVADQFAVLIRQNVLRLVTATMGESGAG